jgi:choline monooxygenase
MTNPTHGFDPSLPLERASTPPASWYTDPAFHDLERATIFRRCWQPVARTDQLRQRGDFVSGDLAGEPWVVVRDEVGALRAFFNVCRHHAACVASGAGNADHLTCPYHGWTYGLDGRLRSAPRLGSVREFDRERFGLAPLEVDRWGPLVFIRLEPGGAPLAELMHPLDGAIDTGSLRFVTRRRYEIACNWKVYVDNYLDGGYHVDHLHRGLAAQLDLGSYRTELSGRVSLQLCSAGAGRDVGTGRDVGAGVDFAERVGEGAAYAFVYPNFMLNRYGPILDTNWVLPLGHERTLTIFDYWFEEGRDAPELVERSLVASDRVQLEDVQVCESVQRGMGSSSFDQGRYAATEQAAYHFHRLLAADLDGD